MVAFDLIDVRLFIDVAEMKSLTRGAERSNMTPPSASLRIKNVEERLHAKLLYRSNRGVTLTPAGRAFVDYGRLILVDAQRLQDNLGEYSRGTRGQVRVLADATAVTELFPSVLATFMAQHPDVNVHFDEQPGDAILRAVSGGTADIGIVDGNVHGENLRIVPYRQERLVVVTPKDHALGRCRRVAFVDTLDAEHVCLAEGTALSSLLDQIAHSLDHAMKIQARVGSFESLCRLIEARIGIGVMPECVARRHAKQMAIRVIPMNDTWAIQHLQICIRSLETLPRCVQWLVDALLLDSHVQAKTA